MIDANKLQYYTMAARMRGYADGLDEHKHMTLINMLNNGALLLEMAWNEYQETLPPDHRIKG